MSLCNSGKDGERVPGDCFCTQIHSKTQPTYMNLDSRLMFSASKFIKVLADKELMFVGTGAIAMLSNRTGNITAI